MHGYDIIAVVLLVLACTAFLLGGVALSRTEDLLGLYWLVAGTVTLRAATQIARSGVRR